jgi:predicted ABC-type sugar transport system permease subunit
MNEKEFWQIVYRALCMILSAINDRYQIKDKPK